MLPFVSERGQAAAQGAAGPWGPFCPCFLQDGDCSEGTSARVQLLAGRYLLVTEQPISDCIHKGLYTQ